MYIYYIQAKVDMDGVTLLLYNLPILTSTLNGPHMGNFSYAYPVFFSPVDLATIIVQVLVISSLGQILYAIHLRTPAVEKSSEIQWVDGLGTFPGAFSRVLAAMGVYTWDVFDSQH